MNYSELIQIARKVKKNSYSPYSKFRVGAVLVTNEGNLYSGVNVENSSYGLTNCAERTAVFSAVSEGERNFKTIVLVSDAEDFIPPCGACRQVLMEVCGKDLEVVMSNSDNEIRILKLEDLLPLSFNKEFLEK
ncbi:MAG: cytidine deaminase [Ignavibacteriae bacterium]|nr:cytidine deaminase [Ignavibacteriota bacterium]MCB9205776.1 cytidine deaminase [Ignavibacteriales bacterium]MCB9209938.1 cytidine deaminase [Ignavibacteriales bacterium]MCB9219347.1 cytidine deaminase [Ignavibacteriales bacterium]MCB9260234.1 cytidine deaminase [Ignavibacteriales bacterium]